MRVINREVVRNLLTMDSCIELMREAFRAEAEGRTNQPIRQSVSAPNGAGLLAWMPGALTAPDLLGIKVLSIFAGNFGSSLPSHQGAMLLLDTNDGRLIALIDAREITAIRTAAATAAATDILARRDASTLAIFGYGEQAETHLDAVRRVRSISRTLVWGRDFAKSQAFAAAHGAEGEIRAVASPRQAAEADILCLTTAATEPYLEGKWLRPGQHINAVGSSNPAAAEIDIEAVACCRFYVDYAKSAQALAGELRAALEAGAIPADHIVGSVGDVMIGRAHGRRDAGEITVFKSLGMVAEDPVAAEHILRRAEAADEGITFDF